MNLNLNNDQLFKNHIFNVNQYENAQAYEHIMFLIMELQCERSRSQYMQQINEKNVDFIEKKRLTSQREMNDQIIQNKQQNETLQNNIAEKNQVLYQYKQQIEVLIQEKKNLERGIENYKREILDQNKESTAVNILNLENQRLQDNLRFEQSQFEVQKIKLEKQNFELATENQQLNEQYKNLSLEYQKLRMHFENEQILSKKFQLQLAQFNSSKPFQKNYEQLKEKYEELKNQNDILKEMISKNLQNKQYSIDKQFDNIEELKNQMIKLKNENFELKLNSIRGITKKISAPETLMRPKKEKDQDFQPENLSVSQDPEDNQYTPKSFYKMPTNPHTQPKEFQNAQQYFNEKQKILQDMNDKDIKLDQEKLFQLKRLNELVSYQVKESLNTQTQNNKLLNFIKNLDDIKDVNHNVEAQLLLQDKQKQLDVENQKIEYLKNLNNYCIQQIQFLRGKKSQMNTYQNQFEKLSNKITGSMIKKPNHEEITQQKDFLRRITQNYKMEFNNFLQLDKQSDQKLAQQNSEEINIQRVFNELDQNHLSQSQIVESFTKIFKKCQQLKSNYQNLFEIWIQNEQEIQKLYQQINQQELQLSMIENSFIEENQKNLFRNNNQHTISKSNNNLTRSLHPQDMQEQHQSQFKPNQTIGGDANLQNIGSLDVSEQDPLEIFHNKNNSKANPRVTFKNNQNVLNLEDSYFQSDQKQNVLDYSFSTKRENDNNSNQFNGDKNHNQNDDYSSQRITEDQDDNSFKLNAKFAQTKNTEFFVDDLQSQSPSNKTNPNDVYLKYQVQDDNNNQNKNLKYNEQGSKRSYKSDFSRQFSNIGGVVGNKKMNLIRQTTTRQNKQQSYLQQNYQKEFNQSNIVKDQQVEYSQQNDQQNNNPYQVQQNDYQQYNYVQKQDTSSFKEQIKIQNQVLLGIMRNLSKSNIEIDQLPQAISDIIKENNKLKFDLEQKDKQYQEVLLQIQLLKLENQNLQQKSQTSNTNYMQQDQRNNLQNYQDIFSGTKILANNNSQRNHTNNIDQNNTMNNQTNTNIFDQQTSNISRTQKVQVTQLLEENDYLLQKVQSERKRNFGINGQDKINNLEDLLSQYEQQLTKQKEKIISLQNQIQLEKNSKIEIEKLYQEQISKKNTEIINLNNQIQNFENKIKIFKENESTIITQKNDKSQNNIDIELLQEKNERLLKKIKDLQQQKLGASQNVLNQGRNMDYYIDLISKLKQENKQLKNENSELDQLKRDNLYLKSQLEIYKDADSNKKLITTISYQNKKGYN